MIFQGGGGPPVPPLDPHLNYDCDNVLVPNCCGDIQHNFVSFTDYERASNKTPPLSSEGLSVSVIKC